MDAAVMAAAKRTESIYIWNDFSKALVKRAPREDEAIFLKRAPRESDEAIFPQARSAREISAIFPQKRAPHEK